MNPFAIGIFPEFLDVVGRKEGFACAEPVVDFDEIEACANGCTELYDMSRLT